MKKIRMYGALLLILCLVGVLLLSGCDRPAQDEPGDGDHTHLLWKLNAVLPGCTTTGLTEGSVCSICDEILVAQEEIPALGHDAVDDPIIELGCVVDGKSAGSHCSRCDKKFERQRITERSTGHRYENGICTVCGEAIEYSQGLKLLPRKDGTYAVSGIGTFEGRHLVIPETAPDGAPITEIRDRAFENCTTLRSVHIPDSIVSIGKSAFEGSGVVYVRLPNTLSYISDSMLGGCRSLESIAIPEGVERIETYAFSGCLDLTSVTIPSTVKSIGDGAFRNCSSLREIEIPDGVTDLAATAFDYASELVRVRYPRTLEHFYGFAYCPKLSEIEIPEDHTSLYFKDGYVLGKTNKTLYHMPIGGTIPDDGSVVHLYAGSMKHHPITEIVLPDSIRTISSAFAGNTTLTRIVLPEGMLSVSPNAFDFCTALREVVLPSSLLSIDNYAFDYCSALTDITLPDGLLYVGRAAFRNCTSLTDIVLPESLKEVKQWAFQNCTGLTELVFHGKTEKIGSYSFEDCTSLARVIIKEGVTEIEDGAFSGCSALQELTLPKSLTSIGAGAFSGCSSLTEIDIPYLDSTSKSAFGSCTSLVRATIGEGVTQVADGLFNGCTALRYVYIPSTAKWIGNATFLNADSLETVEYGGTAEQWEKVRVDAGNTAVHMAELICLQ